ncbi:dolichyl-phosphate-mannose--protein mannosyltransferase [Brevibacterium album]|uniref:dolichyl-phosphate-mannose--protein mannosyltransferase n=1 Tax=Brevibacterium album TaxID=417948 RepID=UPI00040279C9|nr:phospholipid carrier-dependent glycosyltransferase [Brevibacterium album]
MTAPTADPTAATSSAADPRTRRGRARAAAPGTVVLGLSVRTWGWLLPALIAAVGGVLRFFRLGTPGTLIFDETYYVKEGWSLANFGYERSWPDEPNPAFEAGDPWVVLGEGDFVVHPPLGKWLIGWGIELFGQANTFGWRFSAALVGTLSILMLGVIAWKLLGSVWLGAIAALLLAVDGEHLVHSRTSLLDIFVMFFVLAGFGLLVADRLQTRGRIDRALTAAGAGASAADLRSHLRARAPWLTPEAWGPSLGMRPYRLAAGLALGCAMGVKWSGLYALAVFGLMTVIWDWGHRRRMGVRHPWRAALLKDAVPAFCSLVPVAFAVYVVSWTGWIVNRGGYYRDWAEQNSGWWDFLPDWLVSLARYHKAAYDFHVGLDSEHTYMSNPWGWIVQWRPTSFYYKTAEAGGQGCAVDQCSSAITSVGNPVVWGLAPLAVLVLLFAWAVRRDWRAEAVLAGLLATWAPWFMYQERTIFTFYTIVMVPFVVLGLTYALGLLWGRQPGAEAGSPRPEGTLVLRRTVVGLVLAGAIMAFAFFWPVWTATWIPREAWEIRMWNPTWI